MYLFKWVYPLGRGSQKPRNRISVDSISWVLNVENGTFPDQKADRELLHIDFLTLVY